jgi:hypothetical protein
MSDAEIRPYRAQIPQVDLDDLKERLRCTRWPDELPGASWDYGVRRAAGLPTTRINPRNRRRSPMLSRIHPQGGWRG